MELYLIRHGERYRNISENYDHEKKTMNPLLTPNGILQAEALAQRCKDIPFDAIWSSDLKRAMHTAEILNGTVKTQWNVSAAFREIDVGELDYKTWDDFPELYAKWSRREEDIAYPGGENGAMVWERCKNELDGILASDAERVAIVCHGGTIRVMICGLLGLPMQKRFYIGNPPVNCAVTILQQVNDEWFLHVFNDYSHIANL